jgi:hypothetical protein
MNPLGRLHELIASEGEPLAGALGAHAPVEGGAGLGALVASGPRAQSDPDEYELLFEAVYEGYLLHYATSRLLVGADANLALLAGDRLYALGLERLVGLGDLDAVLELADVIALCALLVGRGQADACEPLWRAGAHAVGWGADERHREAKALARAGNPAALGALVTLHPRATVA